MFFKKKNPRETISNEKKKATAKIYCCEMTFNQQNLKIYSSENK